MYVLKYIVYWPTVYPRYLCVSIILSFSFRNCFRLRTEFWFSAHSFPCAAVRRRMSLFFSYKYKYYLPFDQAIVASSLICNANCFCCGQNGFIKYGRYLLCSLRHWLQQLDGGSMQNWSLLSYRLGFIVQLRAHTHDLVHSSWVMNSVALCICFRRSQLQMELISCWFFTRQRFFYMAHQFGKRLNVEQ